MVVSYGSINFQQYTSAVTRRESVAIISYYRTISKKERQEDYLVCAVYAADVG